MTAQACVLNICRYIASVVPVTDSDHLTNDNTNDIDTLRPRAQAAGLHIAVSLLAHHFALPKSNGIQQLCIDISSFQGDELSHQVLSSNAAGHITQEVAASLVAVVDTAGAASWSDNNAQSSLNPRSFITHVVHQFIHAASILHLQQVPHSQSHGSSTSSLQQPEADHSCNQATNHQLAFMSDVCGRFCRRGYSTAVAQALWQCMPTTPEQQHHSGHQPQQQALQQQLQQPPPQHEAEPEHDQQQQQQQPFEPSQQDKDIEACQTPAAPPALMPPTCGSQQAVCCIISAIQDAAALDKLLPALLQQAAAEGQADDRVVGVMQCIVQPLWCRGTVR